MNLQSQSAINRVDTTTVTYPFQDTFTPPSETETSDSPLNSDSVSSNPLSPIGSNSSSSVRRSVSFKDRIMKGDDFAENVSPKRRNSDIELKVG